MTKTCGLDLGLRAELVGGEVSCLGSRGRATRDARAEGDDAADAARSESDVSKVTLGRPEVADAGREVAPDVAPREAKRLAPEE
jgi:hypothetical protein